MKTNFAPIAVWLFAAASLFAADGKKYDEASTPRTLLDWRQSSDGKIAVCLSTDKTTFGAKEPIAVRCAVKNCTDMPLTIIRPFGDPFYARSAGIVIMGPDGKVAYRGPMKDYVLGTSSFMELGAHSVFEETMVLPGDVFPGLGKAGLYAINYQFSSCRYPQEPAPGGIWLGAVKTGTVNILVQHN